MRVIHFADLHIGVERYGRPLPDRPWNSRVQDFLDAFDFLVDYAIAEGADAVIFAGDAYKDREPNQTYQREFARRIRRLSEAGIATLLLVGNHDLGGAEGRAHALEIYRELGVPNVWVGDNAWFATNGIRPILLQTRSGPLQVAILPWPQIGRYTARNPDAASEPLEAVFDRVRAEMANVIRLQAESLDPDVPAILAAHITVDDRFVLERPGSEQQMQLGTAPVLSKASLSAHSFDYVALGHYHNRVQLDLHTPTFYAGSLQPVDFGEEGERKGFVVFDLDPRRPKGARIGGSGTPRFVDVPTRKFVTIEVRPKEPDPMPEVLAAVERRDIRDAIVRVTVHLDEDQRQHFHPFEVRRLLEEAHYVVHVATPLPERPRFSLPVGVEVRALSPVDALDHYLRARKVPDARREKLLAAARELVEDTLGSENA
jgi:exonuclease SbcD